LDHNAAKAEGFHLEDSRAVKLTRIAEFNAGIMAIHPFQDLPHSLVITRTVGAAIAESQIYHSMRAAIHHTIDGADYYKALGECLTGNLNPLRAVFGSIANILEFAKTTKKTHDHQL
jgi:hypothetical protein